MDIQFINFMIDSRNTLYFVDENGVYNIKWLRFDLRSFNKDKRQTFFDDMVLSVSSISSVIKNI
ncbi:MAG: hypothetical protein JRI96_14405 [Deltaproteobacteria bacterium]|nr:hypothetical protein [Deltaproteobacteria bacterium]